MFFRCSFSLCDATWHAFVKVVAITVQCPQMMNFTYNMKTFFLNKYVTCTCMVMLWKFQVLCLLHFSVTKRSRYVKYATMFRLHVRLDTDLNMLKSLLLSSDYEGNVQGIWSPWRYQTHLSPSLFHYCFSSSLYRFTFNMKNLPLESNQFGVTSTSFLCDETFNVLSIRESSKCRLQVRTHFL